MNMIVWEIGLLTIFSYKLGLNAWMQLNDGFTLTDFKLLIQLPIHWAQFHPINVLLSYLLSIHLIFCYF